MIKWDCGYILRSTQPFPRCSKSSTIIFLIVTRYFFHIFRSPLSFTYHLKIAVGSQEVAKEKERFQCTLHVVSTDGYIFHNYPQTSRPGNWPWRPGQAVLSRFYSRMKMQSRYRAAAAAQSARLHRRTHHP